MEDSSNNNPSAAAATAQQPWTKIVRGGESDGAPSPSPSTGGDQDIPATENQSESSDNDNAGNNNGKKPAVWNRKPSNNGAASTTVESGGGPVVMGAALWPALSESTKASLKPSPIDSGSTSAPQSPVQTSLSSPKPSTSNANHNPNLGRPTRQRSMKREGGGNVQANGSNSHQPSSTGEGYHSHNGSGRDNVHNQSNRETGHRSSGGDHQQPRNFRRGNGGRGDGTHFGGRRGDQDRGNHDWNHQRSFNGRDTPQLQPRLSPRGYGRTPPVSTPFVAPVGPPPMRPFIDVPMHMYCFPTGMPLVAPPMPPLYYNPVADPQLKLKLVNQIEYYFSNENLIKDTYLRNNMDQDGWVLVSLIGSFKKVKELTEDLQLILDAVKSSKIVEAQGDRIRRCDDYRRWIMPPSVNVPIPESHSPRSPNVAALSVDIQSVTLDAQKPHTSNDGASSSGV